MLLAEEAVEIRVLRRQGRSIREIARTLKVSRNTVRRYLRRERLPRYERQARPSKLDPYKHYINERVKAAAPDWIPATVPRNLRRWLERDPIEARRQTRCGETRTLASARGARDLSQGLASNRSVTET